MTGERADVARRRWLYEAWAAAFARPPGVVAIAGLLALFAVTTGIVVEVLRILGTLVIPAHSLTGDAVIYINVVDVGAIAPYEAVGFVVIATAVAGLSITAGILTFKAMKEYRFSIGRALGISFWALLVWGTTAAGGRWLLGEF